MGLNWTPGGDNSLSTGNSGGGRTPGGRPGGLVANLLLARSDSDNGGVGVSLSLHWAPGGVDGSLAVLSLGGWAPCARSSGGLGVALVVVTRSDGEGLGVGIGDGLNWAPRGVGGGGVVLRLGGWTPGAWSSGGHTVVVVARGDGDSLSTGVGLSDGGVVGGGWSTNIDNLNSGVRRLTVLLLDLSNEVVLRVSLGEELSVESSSQSSGGVGARLLLVVNVEDWSRSLSVQLVGRHGNLSASVLNVVPVLLVGGHVVGIHLVVVFSVESEGHWEVLRDGEGTRASVQVHYGHLLAVDTTGHVLSVDGGCDSSKRSEGRKLHEKKRMYLLINKKNKSLESGWEGGDLYIFSTRGHRG